VVVVMLLLLTTTISTLLLLLLTVPVIGLRIDGSNHWELQLLLTSHHHTDDGQRPNEHRGCLPAASIGFHAGFC
jgi:hypothetical protein